MKKLRKLFRGAIMGAPGSGKGTISKKIVDTFDVVHVSTGDIFRQIVLSGTASIEKTVKQHMAEGKLVPDDLVVKVILDKLGHIKDKNWICDGFPRTLVQAEKLFEAYPLNLVINLKVPFDQIVERIKDRWVHVPSGRIYNLKYKPPKVPGKDDVTGEPLIQRADDKPEAVLERLKTYANQSDPVLEYYKKKGVLSEFSGTSSDELWKSIEEVLKKHMKPKS